MEKTFEVAGVRTLVTDRQGGEPAIVCIHGNSLSRRLFDPLFVSSSLRQRRLVAYDLPGHGASARSPHGRLYTIKGYASHLSELLSSLRIGRCFLVGVSLGGHIAMQAADSELSPKIAGLFLCGAPPIRRIEDFERAFVSLPGGLSLFQRNIRQVDAERIARSLTRNPLYQLLCVDSILATDPEARARLVESFATEELHNEYSFLLGTHLPVMLCYGENEQVVKLAYLDEIGLLRALPESLKILAHEDHLPDMSDSDGLSGALSLFVGCESE